jgi:hypothetical protein
VGAREDRAERAGELVPWAAVGCAEYWLTEAERYASHACKWDGVVYQSVETYREVWERHKSSPVFRPFVWPNPAGRSEQ